MTFLSAGERAAATSKARIFRGRLLSPADYLRLLECETVGDIAVTLSRTPAYETYFDRASRPEQMHRGELEGIISTVPMLEENDREDFTRMKMARAGASEEGGMGA